ncbi:MAG: hypothetical protein AAF433_12565 [Bacteroidota bacterium]
MNLLRPGLLGLLLVSSLISLNAQQFGGIFQPTDAELDYTTSVGWEALVAEQQQQSTNGFRMIDLESVRSTNGGERTFYAIFTESSLQDSVGTFLGWPEFVKAKRQMYSAGWMIVDVHGYALNESDTQYIGVWVKDDNPHKIARLSTREGLDNRIRAMGRQRFKLKRVHVINSPSGEPEFIALFHYSPVYEYNFVYYSDDAEDFRREYQERYQSNTRLIDFASFFDEGKTWQLGIFQAADYDVDFRRSSTKSELDSTTMALNNESGLSLLNLNIW